MWNIKRGKRMKKEFKAVEKIVEALEGLPIDRCYAITEFAMSILRHHEPCNRSCEPMPVQGQSVTEQIKEDQEEIEKVAEELKEKSEYTIADIRAAIKDYAKKYDKTKALKVIKSFGVEKVNELKPEQYNEFMGKM